MDEDPPPPNDSGTPEEAVPSTEDSGSSSLERGTSPDNNAVSGQDNAVDPNATTSDPGSVDSGIAGSGGADSASSTPDGDVSRHLMDQLHNLSSFDTGCLIFLGLSIFWGLTRGGSRELSGILVWIGAFWLSLRTSNAVMAWANPSLPETLQNSNAALWITRIAVFVIGVVVFSTLVDRVSYIAKSNLSRSMDSLLGLAFGAVRGYALLVIFCLGASWVSGNWIESVSQNSVMMPYIAKGVQILQGYVPPSLQSYLALPDTNTLQDSTNSQ